MSGPPGIGRASDPAAAVSGRQADDLDEFLTRAVDRQIAEQRALRASLDELRAAVDAARNTPAPAPPIDLEDLKEHVRRTVAEQVGGGTDSLTNEVRELRDTVMPSVQRAIDATSDVRSLDTDLATLRDAVGSMSADLDGIAQALIDLNSGLREWAQGVDGNITAVRKGVERIGKMAAKSVERGEAARTPVADAPQIQAAEAGADERIKETVELSLYLADQIEGFDRVISGMSDLPTKLEGVVSQALRRTLTARAKLDNEAEAAMDEALAALDEHVETMADVVERFAANEEAIRTLSAGQSDLVSRLESLRDEVGQSNEAIATALDALGEGKDPRASALLTRSAKKKPVKTAAKKKPSTVKAKAKPRKATRRKPPSSDEPTDEPTAD